MGGSGGGWLGCGCCRGDGGCYVGCFGGGGAAAGADSWCGVGAGVWASGGACGGAVAAAGACGVGCFVFCGELPGEVGALVGDEFVFGGGVVGAGVDDDGGCWGLVVGGRWVWGVVVWWVVGGVGLVVGGWAGLG